MSDSTLFDEPDSPPPPAYELTAQEFDQKASHLIEESRNEPLRRSNDGDLWEVWDEAAFDTAVAQLTLSEGTSSSSSSSAPDTISETARAKAKEAEMSSHRSEGVAPLRIHKKSAPSHSSMTEKERPGWYAEAQLDRDQPSGSQATPQSPRRELPQAPRRSSYEEREATPPPMFEAVGPSLDGPPYEGAPAIIMTYSGSDSRPASPLQSPTSPAPPFSFSHHPTPSRSFTSSPQPSHYRSSPGPQPSHGLPVTVSHAPAVSRVNTDKPSVSNVRPAANFAVLGPRVPFNPQMAYNRKPRYGLPEEEPLPQIVDASAFYTSSVSSYISSRAPTAPRRNPLHPPPTTYASPTPQRASYMPMTQMIQQQQQPASGYNNYTNHNVNTTSYPVTPQNQPAYGQPMPSTTQTTYSGYNQPGFQQDWTQPGGYPGSQYGRSW